MLLRLAVTRYFFLFSLMFFVSSAWAQTVKEQIERVDTEEIKLNVSVYDAGGEFVRDVGVKDLVITENGRLNQPTSVRRTPANVLILLDVGSEIAYAKRRRTTAETAANLVGALNNEDTIAIMQYGDKTEVLADWTKDKTAILPKLDERKLAYGKRSVFIDALDKSVDFFRRAPVDNRHLVIISDGVDSFNDESAKKRAMENLLSSDVNVHVISYTRLQQQSIESMKKVSPSTKKVALPPGAEPPVRGTTPTFGISINLDREMMRRRKEQTNQLQNGEKFLTSITEDTNGEIYLPETEDEMKAKPGQLAKNIDSQYVVTYTPKKPLSESPDGEIRLIEAVSRRAGLAVLGRRKFVVVKTGDDNMPKN